MAVYRWRRLTVGHYHLGYPVQGGPTGFYTRNWNIPNAVWVIHTGVISGLAILEGRQNFQKEGHIVRFCAIKEGQYERNFIMKIHSAQTRPLKKNLFCVPMLHRSWAHVVLLPKQCCPIFERMQQTMWQVKDNCSYRLHLINLDFVVLHWFSQQKGCGRAPLEDKRGFLRTRPPFR